MNGSEPSHVDDIHEGPDSDDALRSIRLDLMGIKSDLRRIEKAQATTDSYVRSSAFRVAMVVAGVEVLLEAIRPIVGPILKGLL